MQRPAILNLARGVDLRLIALGLVALLTFGVGFFGQGSWEVGAATPTAVSAIVTDVVGGAGSRKPVRVKISLAVTNSGAEPVRVLGPDSNGNGARLFGLSPSQLIIDPDVIGRIDADVGLDCDRPEPLLLPDLRLELPDGVRRGFPIGGSDLLLEACSRAAPAVRPLVATVPTPAPSPSPTAPAARTGDRQFTVLLRSPTGRRSDVRAVRAGGVDLPMSPATVTVAGQTPTTIHLTAPATCPTQWQVAGIPSTLAVDLAPDPANDSAAAPATDTTTGAAPNPDSNLGFGATVRIRLGPVLTTWLLATSCPETR